MSWPKELREHAARIVAIAEAMEYRAKHDMDNPVHGIREAFIYAFEAGAKGEVDMVEAGRRFRLSLTDGGE